MRTLHLPREYGIVKQPIKPLPGGTPLKPFPRWLRLILESKIPVGLLPQEEFLMTSRQLSQSLFRKYPHQEFDLTDPYLHYLPWNGYNALNDPNCRHYFYRPSIYRHLMKEGFISESNRVIVNLHDFNKYRAYLHRLHINEIKQYRKREHENMMYERAMLERRRLQEFWNSSEYRLIQERRSRCVDLCRQLRDLDEAERKKYLKFYTAEVKRKYDWKREQLLESMNENRLIGIERQLLEMKEIKERSIKRKQLSLLEWMKQIKEHEEKLQDMKIIEEMERKKIKQLRASRLRKYQEKQILLEDEMRKMDELDRKNAIELRKAVVDRRKQKTIDEFLQIRSRINWKRLPVKKTISDKQKHEEMKIKSEDDQQDKQFISVKQKKPVSFKDDPVPSVTQILSKLEGIAEEEYEDSSYKEDSVKYLLDETSSDEAKYFHEEEKIISENVKELSSQDEYHSAEEYRKESGTEATGSSIALEKNESKNIGDEL